MLLPISLKFSTHVLEHIFLKPYRGKHLVESNGARLLGFES